MKLHKAITVDGVQVQLTLEDVRLSLFTPGRASFNVVADAPLSGIVQYSAGFDPQHLQAVFTGYIENSFAIDQKQQRLFCRELPATLNRLMPLSLRNVTLNQVLAELSAESGVDFVTPDQPYTNRLAPAFYSVGSGYYCLDTLARVYQIPQFMWQQQGNGQVYVGSWQHSYWSGRTIELPTKWQAESGVANSARIPLIPKLRPGVRLATGHTVTKVQIGGAHMDITWNSNPWGTRWTNRSSV